MGYPRRPGDQAVQAPDPELELHERGDLAVGAAAAGLQRRLDHPHVGHHRHAPRQPRGAREQNHAGGHDTGVPLL